MHKTSPKDKRIEFALFDADNRRSLMYLLPEAFMKQIHFLYESQNSYLLGLGEWELMREAGRQQKVFSPQDHRLRLNFWIEWDYRQSHPNQHVAKMNMARVIGRATSKENFYKHIITDPWKLAFILTPTTEYKEAIEIALSVSINKMTEILNVPLNGKSMDQIEKLSKIAITLHRYIRSLRAHPSEARQKISLPLGETQDLFEEEKTQEEILLELEKKNMALREQALTEKKIGQGES